MRWLALASLLFVPTCVQAGSPESPELTDPVGDATLQGIPVPWGEDSDLLAAWFTDDAEGLHAYIRVADLAGVAAAPANVDSDAMFFVRWATDHADPDGPDERDGIFTLRADYQPSNPRAWRFWAELPCRDGQDSDGCAGDDRDILDEVPGEALVAENTIHLVLPWKHLGNPRAGDGIVALTASTQFVYPTWPAYAVDWDSDQERSAQYRYTAFGSPPADPASSDEPPPLPAPTQSTTSPPAPPATQPEGEPERSPEPGMGDDGHAPKTAAPSADARQAAGPAVAWLLLALAVVAIAGRR